MEQAKLKQRKLTPLSSAAQAHLLVLAGYNTPCYSSLLRLLEFNAAAEFLIWEYRTARRLFGATCKACHARVQSAGIGQHWFLQHCPFNISSPHRCRVCTEFVEGLLFWQFNGVAHYGCLNKKEAHDKMAPPEEEVYLSLQWGFPDTTTL